MFHYNGYWRQWSKVLSREGKTITTVDLTPGRYCKWASWEEIKDVNIRTFTVDLIHGDFLTETLPLPVLEEIIKNIGWDAYLTLTR